MRRNINRILKFKKINNINNIHLVELFSNCAYLYNNNDFDLKIYRLFYNSLIIYQANMTWQHRITNNCFALKKTL